jgi:hypothetical protein
MTTIQNRPSRGQLVDTVRASAEFRCYWPAVIDSQNLSRGVGSTREKLKFGLDVPLNSRFTINGFGWNTVKSVPPATTNSQGFEALLAVDCARWRKMHLMFAGGAEKDIPGPLMWAQQARASFQLSRRTEIVFIHEVTAAKAVDQGAKLLYLVSTRRNWKLVPFYDWHGESADHRISFAVMYVWLPSKRRLGENTRLLGESKEPLSQ